MNAKRFWLHVAYVYSFLMTFALAASFIAGLLLASINGWWPCYIWSVVVVPITVGAFIFTWWVAGKAVGAE